MVYFFNVRILVFPKNEMKLLFGKQDPCNWQADNRAVLISYETNVIHMTGVMRNGPYR